MLTIFNFKILCLVNTIIRKNKNTFGSYWVNINKTIGTKVIHIIEKNYSATV